MNCKHKYLPGDSDSGPFETCVHCLDERKLIQVYELHFEFRIRDNWPAAAVLIAFRRNADEVIFLLNYLGRDKLVDIRLTTMEI